MTKRRTTTVAIFETMLLLSLLLIGMPLVFAASDTIDLEEFRWASFPIRVLVEMNQWSTNAYALAVHEAVNSWRGSIWQYTELFNDTTLDAIDFAFHLSTVNSTNNPDVLITFAQTVILPGTDTIGLTNYTYDDISHQPEPPITINITTYSATADSLFVKNVALHEFGHALGLGHASSSSTDNGPELMFRSTQNGAVYPSTLDVYALVQLYHGNYGQSIILPSSIPYEMLYGTNTPPPLSSFWQKYFLYVILLAAAVLVLILIIAVFLTARKAKSQQSGSAVTPTSEEPAPPRVQPARSSAHYLTDEFYC